MKRRTTPELPIQVDIDISTVSSIDFIFKQDRDEACTVSLKKTYPGTVTYYDGLFHVPFTESDTCKFKANAQMYLDTRIELTNGSVPETDIVQLYMRDTLFAVGDVT